MHGKRVDAEGPPEPVGCGIVVALSLAAPISRTWGYPPNLPFASSPRKPAAETVGPGGRSCGPGSLAPREAQCASRTSAQDLRSAPPDNDPK